MPFRSSSIAKSESIIGVKSNCLVVISDGVIVVAFIHIDVTPVPKGEGAFGIQSDRLVKISDGSIVVAFICIDDTSVPKGVGALGIESNRLVVISEGSIVVALIHICVAPANKPENAFGIEFNRVVVTADGFIIIAGVGVCVGLADRGSIARLRLGLFARLLLRHESIDWYLLSFLTVSLRSRHSCLALLLRRQQFSLRFLRLALSFRLRCASCLPLPFRCQPLLLLLVLDFAVDFGFGRRSCLAACLFCVEVSFRLSRLAPLLPVNIGLQDMLNEHVGTRAN